MKTMSGIILGLLLICGCSVPSKTVKIYFLQKDILVAVEREVPTNENPVVIAIDQLLKGPSEQETADGLTSMIPSGTRSRNVDVEGHTAIIDLNSGLLEYEGGTSEAKAIVSQIIYTATSVKGISQVILKLQGSDQFLIGPAYSIDHPLTRDDIKD